MQHRITKIALQEWFRLWKIRLKYCIVCTHELLIVLWTITCYHYIQWDTLSLRFERETRFLDFNPNFRFVLFFLRDIASIRGRFPSIKCTLIVNSCMQCPTESRPRIRIMRVRWLCSIMDMKTRWPMGEHSLLPLSAFLPLVYLLFSTAPRRPWLGIWPALT